MDKTPIGIDPTIDCVFRALLGSEPHKALLLDFLNAVLTPKAPIVEAELLNPFNYPNHAKDDTTIVDVKARDAAGRVFQIEMQSANEGGLKPRILYTWSDNYQEQLRSGEDYTKLRPVISIWVLGENILRNSKDFHHHFEVVDARHRVRLSDHLAIHTLELRKWLRAERLDPVGKWMYFFKEASALVGAASGGRHPRPERSHDHLKRLQRPLRTPKPLPLPPRPDSTTTNPREGT